MRAAWLRSCCLFSLNNLYSADFYLLYSTKPANHYLYETINRTISIKQQNKTAAADALLLTASGLALGYLGYVSLSTLTTIVGAKSAVETLFTGDSGAQFAINVKTYVYKSGSPTSTYWGYGLIVFSNAKTGKSLTTKKIIIGKTG